MTKHTNRSVRLDVGFRKELSAAHVPATNIQELWCHSSIHRRPVLSAVNNLDMTVNVRTHLFDKRNLADDGLGIAHHQRTRAAGSHPNPASRPTTGLHPYEVVSQTLQLIFNLARRGMADGDYANECTNTNCNPQDSEHTSHPMSAKRSKRFA
jgi:hypothetical protein